MAASDWMSRQKFLSCLQHKNHCSKNEYRGDGGRCECSLSEKIFF